MEFFNLDLGCEVALSALDRTKVKGVKIQGKINEANFKGDTKRAERLERRSSRIQDRIDKLEK